MPEGQAWHRFRGVGFCRRFGPRRRRHADTTGRGRIGAVGDRPGGRAAAAQARHFLQGGDAATGAACAWRAGLAAEASYDWSAAAAHHRTALAAWERLAGHEAERAEAHRRLGDVLFFSGIDPGQGGDHLR